MDEWKEICIRMTDSVNHPRSVIHRFWKYVNKRSKNSCWNWTGSRMIRGNYGQLNDRGKVLKAHRLSYEIHKGLIPKGMFICHKCNNPPCCNPNHLYAGTPAQNWNDTIAAGTRFVPKGDKGENHHSAKLTIQKVKFIKRSNKKGIDLARQFGVSNTTITNIRKEKSWKKITI